MIDQELEKLFALWQRNAIFVLNPEKDLWVVERQIVVNARFEVMHIHRDPYEGDYVCYEVEGNLRGTYCYPCYKKYLGDKVTHYDWRTIISEEDINVFQAWVNLQLSIR